MRRGSSHSLSSLLQVLVTATSGELTGQRTSVESPLRVGSHERALFNGRMVESEPQPGCVFLVGKGEYSDQKNFQNGSHASMQVLSIRDMCT